jgi:4-hydroxy-4-methyl-2-oxoglutarate aldolase
MRKVLLLIFIGFTSASKAQQLDRDQVIFLTQEWKGERYADGRPKVPDALLKRMKNVGIEEAWGILKNKGFNNQYGGNWQRLRDDEPFVGRALTAQYMPLRPDLQSRLIEKGKKDGRVGPMNSWPIDMLQKGDVYVADCFEKIKDGTLIGDNLGNSIYSKTGTGVIFDAAARDIDGLSAITGFNVYVRGWHPSFLQETMLMGINHPLIIGEVTVLPGDVVLARKEGVVFVPAHLAEEVVINAEFIQLRDKFAISRLKEGVYTPGQIDTSWSEEIKKDFLKWVKEHPGLVPLSMDELEKFMKGRTW